MLPSPVVLVSDGHDALGLECGVGIVGQPVGVLQRPQISNVRGDGWSDNQPGQCAVRGAVGVRDLGVVLTFHRGIYRSERKGGRAAAHRIRHRIRDVIPLIAQRITTGSTDRK